MSKFISLFQIKPLIFLLIVTCANIILFTVGFVGLVDLMLANYLFLAERFILD